VTVIIDASVLSAFILEEEGYEKIRRVLLEGTFAPELVLTESSNAVLTALRRGRLGNEQSEKAIEVLLSFVGSNVKIIPQENNLVLESFRIAKECNLTSYDASYIALAKSLGGSLASRDPKQLEAARKSGTRTLAM
jgi:predicted nucleic acid-binding protein